MADIPVVIDSDGAQTTSTDNLLAQIVAFAQTYSPGYTANLPGTLIDDLAGTAVGAMSVIDQARVDTINSLTPDGANIPLLQRLGNIYGVSIGASTNTSAYVQFTGTPGYLIPAGFVVSDGTYQYVVQDSVTIPTGGVTGSIYVLAAVTGTWAVPANSITELVTSVPTNISLSVTNASAGTPQQDAETYASYRARVMQAGLVTCKGVSNMIRTALEAINGVVSRTISIGSASSTSTSTGLMVMVSGGDSYSVAGAIYESVLDPSRLIGSANYVTYISQAATAVVTTELTHGLSDGDAVTITGAEGMTGVNGTAYPITVVDPYNFSIAYNSSAQPSYTGGGYINLNPRNTTVTVIDGPDSYAIPIVIPLQQVATIVATWTTSKSNVVSNDALAALAIPALVTYVNGLTAGQNLNTLEMQFVFLDAVSDIISPQLFSSISFSVSLDGYEATVEAGTTIIKSDAQSYLYTSTGNIALAEG